MSLLTSLTFVALVGATCFGSWKAALYWDLRTRDAHDEDPRDQEIRELGAALSIARKELAQVADAKDASSTQAIQLTGKLENASSSLSDIKQKFNATKEHLNKEIEQRQELNEELSVLRRELDQAKTRVTELEVQSQMENAGSDMIAGMDMVAEDEDVDDLHDQIIQLTAEVDRWKKHCAILTNTNKSLRSDHDQSNIDSGDSPPAQQ